MADLMECTLCGYRTVRCGMTNHLKASHQKEYNQYLQKFYSATKDARLEMPVELTKFVGQVKRWGKDKTQTPKVKS